MKYAVYYQADPDDEIYCLFYKTLEEAKATVGNLIKQCEEMWEEDSEQNCPTMDITLMEVKGEVHFTQDGLRLLAR